jgi:peptidoglycan hydrolase-like protein with peptidoglycan-binding domain
MGPRTRAALRDYQKKEGLNPTGRWDEETGNRLGVRMSATTPTDKIHTSTPAASPATPSVSPGTSQAPPAVPEDKAASPAKRQAP